MAEINLEGTKTIGNKVFFAGKAIVSDADAAAINDTESNEENNQNETEENETEEINTGESEQNAGQSKTKRGKNK